MKPEQLIEHPEGGRFREVFRSTIRVNTASGNERSALTHIYFALNAKEVSRLHRVQSDEVWNLYQGKGLMLTTWNGIDTVPHRTELSAASGTFCQVVPAGTWQAAEALGGDVLVGCSVGPGFEFIDFELIAVDSPEADWFLKKHPELASLVHGQSSGCR